MVDPRISGPVVGWFTGNSAEGPRAVHKLKTKTRTKAGQRLDKYKDKCKQMKQNFVTTIPLTTKVAVMIMGR